MLEHVRVDRPIMGRVQDLITPVWRRLAGGCRLNQRTVATVQHAGFRIDELRSHMRGYVVAIKASATEESSGPGRSAVSR